MTFHAKVIAGGKIVIPAELRREFGIRDGDSVVIERAGEGTLAIKIHRQVIEEGQCAFRNMLQRPFTVDEFITDRRAGAREQ